MISVRVASVSGTFGHCKRSRVAHSKQKSLVDYEWVRFSLNDC